MGTFRSDVSFNFMSCFNSFQMECLCSQNRIQRFSWPWFQLNLKMIWMTQRRAHLNTTVETSWYICTSFLSVFLFTHSVRSLPGQHCHGLIALLPFMCWACSHLRFSTCPLGLLLLLLLFWNILQFWFPAMIMTYLLWPCRWVLSFGETTTFLSVSRW